MNKKIFNVARTIFRKLPMNRKTRFAIRKYMMKKRQYGNIKFQSQWSQDLIAYLYFRNKRNGFFVDVGANDGVNFSNSLIFEQLGWGGGVHRSTPGHVQAA